MTRPKTTRKRPSSKGRMTAVSLAVLTGIGSVSAGSLPDTTVPQSCGVQIKGHNHSAANLDEIQKMGMKFVRRGFIWQSVEKKPGVYDFSEYDRLMKDCKERGLSVLGCIAFSNPLYGTVLEARGREGYAKFAAALAVRYKDYDVMWEIWNEPNTRTFWGKHGMHNSEQYAEEYVALVKVVAPAMHKANPDCIVVGGSVSGIWSASYAWMGYCFQKGVLKSGIDAWSLHPYSTKCPEDYLEAYAKVREMMAAAGTKKMPLLNSERGFPIGKAEGYAGGDPKLSREYQAWHFVRQYMVDLLCDIRLTSWYEWSGKEGFSLVEGNNRPTPAYTACKFMIEQLDGYRLDKRIPLDSPRDFVLRFVHKNGGQKLVAWTSPPPGESPDKATTHAVRIPLRASGALKAYKLYGEQDTVEVKNGAIALMLTGAPQYVVVKDNP